MTQLFSEIEQVLSDLLQSGLSTRASAAVPELQMLAEECERVGLHTGGQLLTQLKDALASRNNTILKDDAAITAQISRLVHYLELCEEKMQEERIQKAWSDRMIKEESI